MLASINILDTRKCYNLNFSVIWIDSSLSGPSYSVPLESSVRQTGDIQTVDKAEGIALKGCLLIASGSQKLQRGS